MELLDNHPWRAVILAPIDDVTRSVNESHPQWEYIDTAIAAMGTIAHGKLDIDKIQSSALLLLNETKDMRVIAHLLRTLQHGKKPSEIVLALYLFAEYIEKYWESAPPLPRLKLRLFKQIIQRFIQAQTIFESESIAIERATAASQLERICTYFSEHNLPIDDEFTQLLGFFSSQDSSSEVEKAAQEKPNKSELPLPAARNVSAALKTAPTPIPEVMVNQHNDGEWKRTLIKVTEILAERHPEDPISIRLRRHVIFASLSEPINSQGVTELSPVPADRIADYKAGIAKSDPTRWLKIESDLTVMPFWLEGHFISAQIAHHLGFTCSAEAIREELMRLLTRLPMLINFQYSDKTPFISSEMRRWLTPNQIAVAEERSQQEEQIIQVLRENGLEAALKALNELPEAAEPRQHYYRQKLSARLLSEAGLSAVATDQAKSLFAVCERLPLTEWEPSFFKALTELKNKNS